MSLIDGVGDEVVQFVCVLLILVVSALAWWSTNARPGRYRTVVVMRSRVHRPVTVSIRTRPNLMITNTHSQPSTSSQASASDNIAVSTADVVENIRNTIQGVSLQEMDSIIDADMAMLDNNRLHFYRRIDLPSEIPNSGDSASDDSEGSEDPEPASNAQIREMDSIVSAMEADDSTNTCQLFRPTENNTVAKSALESKKKDDEDQNNVSTSTPDDEGKGADDIVNRENENGDGSANTDTDSDSTEVDNSDKILIKLKYLNDTLKEVEGFLDEMLNDFLQRNFFMELSSESRVRLIFNGHVLTDEAATLRSLGLHDRAVVHCLIHPKRNSPQSSDTESVNGTATPDGSAAERSWDLENVLMTLVSIALTIVWFFRCEYSNMFTASASVALFGLTVFYSVAIFGLYISDTFHFERRAA